LTTDGRQKRQPILNADGTWKEAAQIGPAEPIPNQVQANGSNESSSKIDSIVALTSEAIRYFTRKSIRKSRVKVRVRFLRITLGLAINQSDDVRLRSFVLF
jgi:hypothetical protein